MVPPTRPIFVSVFFCILKILSYSFFLYVCPKGANFVIPFHKIKLVFFVLEHLWFSILFSCYVYRFFSLNIIIMFWGFWKRDWLLHPIRTECARDFEWNPLWKICQSRITRRPSLTRSDCYRRICYSDSVNKMCHVTRVATNFANRHYSIEY